MMSEPSFFSIQLNMFKFAGIPLIQNVTRCASFLQVFLILNVAYLIFSEILFSAVNLSDLKALTECFGHFTTSFNGFVKLLVVWRSKDLIKNLAEETSCLSYQMIQENREKLKTFSAANRYNKMFAWSFVYMCIASASTSLLLPIVGNLIHLCTDQNFDYNMPVKTAFLYDHTKFLFYVLTYLSSAIATCSVVLVSVSY